ncbi:50S ribosomal protein L4 [Patescibacteria group bacterium]|nr:50S ribosomal protein L4 [Patescibacteria group bacterium]
MASVKVYNLDGEVKEELEISDKVFNVNSNEDLLHQVVTGCLANRRGVFAHTKTRGEVSGGGKKPWRQKGTGRARHGSIRSPLWVGGGITFGPRSNRNFKVKINKKTKNKALCMLLTDKLRDSGLLVIEKLEIKEPKTKELFGAIKNLFNKLGKELKGKGLLVTDGEKNIKLASRNLQKLQNIAGKDLSVLDVINSEHIIIERNTLIGLEKRLK